MSSIVCKIYFDKITRVLQLLVQSDGLTLRDLSNYGVFSDPYFPVFGLNTGKCGPEKTLYLDTFHAV